MVERVRVLVSKFFFDILLYGTILVEVDFLDKNRAILLILLKILAGLL